MPKFSKFTKLKNQIDTAFTNAKNAINAIKLAIIAATVPITYY